MVTREQFDQLLPGVQLAAFELLWPAVPALQSAVARVTSTALEVRCAPVMEADDENACRELLSEIVAEAAPGTPIGIEFVAVEEPGEWRTIISNQLFREIAGQLAPWRLEAGR